LIHLYVDIFANLIFEIKTLLHLDASVRKVSRANTAQQIKTIALATNANMEHALMASEITHANAKTDFRAITAT
jgi:hypothetical protein